jgi:hypothetical protein
MKMEQIEWSETSAYKIQTPGNHPEENIQHTEHGESLKSKMISLVGRMRNGSDKSIDKIKRRILCSVTSFPQNRAAYEVMWKITV